MRNFYDVLHNFISPVTGHVLADPDYVLVGNDLGIAIPSPDLIDLRLDQINLRMDFDTLSSAYFIVGFENAQLPNAQVLYNMSDGYLYNTAGIVSTTSTIPIGALPNLTENNIWVGNDHNRPVETQRLSVLNLPPFLTAELINPLSIPPGAPVNFGLNNLYMGGVDIPPNPSEFVEPGIGLRLDPSNLPNLPKGKIWLGTVNYTPPVITFDETPPYVHVSGSLNWDGRSLVYGDNYAVPEAVGLSYGNIFIGDSSGLLSETGLNANELFIGDIENTGRITKTVKLNVDNLPNLTSGKVWQGNEENRPVEISIAPNEATYIVQKVDAGLPNAQSLGTLSTGLLKNTVSIISEVSTGVLSTAISGVDYVNLTQYELLEAEIGTLQSEVAGLLISVGALELEIVALEAEIAFITAVTIAGILASITVIELEIAGLQLEISSANTRIDETNTRIDNLRLNTIPADGDVSFYNFKLVNLADPSSPQDGATKHYVDEAIAGITPNITLTGFVTGGPPVDGVISTTRTPGDLDMGGDRVKNLKQDPVEDLDAISMTFLWNLLNGELEILWP